MRANDSENTNDAAANSGCSPAPCSGLDFSGTTCEGAEWHRVHRHGGENSPIWGRDPKLKCAIEGTHEAVCGAAPCSPLPALAQTPERDVRDSENNQAEQTAETGKEAAGSEKASAAIFLKSGIIK